MGRKRKRRSSVKKKVVKRRSTARDRKIAKVVVGSIWRVQTADTETTATGKEVLSGWKRCRVLKRMNADEDCAEGSVLVEYFDDKDEEPIQYNIVDFIGAADPAPCHVIEIVADAETTNDAVGFEQPAFQPQERGELLPLQRRHFASPQLWKKINVSSMKLGGGLVMLKILKQSHIPCQHVSFRVANWVAPSSMKRP